MIFVSELMNLHDFFEDFELPCLISEGMWGAISVGSMGKPELSHWEDWYVQIMQGTAG